MDETIITSGEQSPIGSVGVQGQTCPTGPMGVQGGTNTDRYGYFPSLRQFLNKHKNKRNNK